MGPYFGPMRALEKGLLFYSLSPPSSLSLSLILPLSVCLSLSTSLTLTSDVQGTCGCALSPPLHLSVSHSPLSLLLSVSPSSLSVSHSPPSCLSVSLYITDPDVWCTGYMWMWYPPPWLSSFWRSTLTSVQLGSLSTGLKVMWPVITLESTDQWSTVAWTACVELMVPQASTPATPGECRTTDRPITESVPKFQIYNFKYKTTLITRISNN